MSLQILHKQLDESTPCPLCQAAMFWVDAEQYDKEINFHECSHCQHRVFSNSNLNCHCDSCLAQRKKILKETRQQEQRKTKTKKDIYEFELGQLSFMHKLFLLALLDDYAQEHTQHQEFIDWEQIKYFSITPNYLFQNSLVKQLVKEQILVAERFCQ